MALVSIDIGASSLTFSTTSPEQEIHLLQLSDGCSFISNVLVKNDADVYIGRYAEKRLYECVQNSFLSVTHILPDLFPWNAKLLKNVEAIDGDLYVSLQINDHPHKMLYKDLLTEFVAKIRAELGALLEDSPITVRLVLPQLLKPSLPLLQAAFEANDCLIEEVVSTADALASVYYYRSTEPGTVAIVDIGEAITNIVICTFTEDHYTILFTDELWFGGQDIDQVVYEYCFSKISKSNKSKMTLRSKLLLSNACRQIKTQPNCQSISVEELVPGFNFSIKFSLSKLERLIRDILNTFGGQLNESLHLAETRGTAISTIVPTGRLVRFAPVMNSIKQVCSGRKIVPLLDPTHDVSLGGLLWKDELCCTEPILPRVRSIILSEGLSKTKVDDGGTSQDILGTILSSDEVHYTDDTDDSQSGNNSSDENVVISKKEYNNLLETFQKAEAAIQKELVLRQTLIANFRHLVNHTNCLKMLPSIYGPDKHFAEWYGLSLLHLKNFCAGFKDVDVELPESLCHLPKARPRPPTMSTPSTTKPKSSLPVPQMQFFTESKDDVVGNIKSLSLGIQVWRFRRQNINWKHCKLVAQLSGSDLLTTIQHYSLQHNLDFVMEPRYKRGSYEHTKLLLTGSVLQVSVFGLAKSLTHTIPLQSLHTADKVDEVVSLEGEKLLHVIVSLVAQ
ncbi:hypothetical protein P9112_007303 [Eukaryota sp. TZLM1-RC]